MSSDSSIPAERQSPRIRVAGCVRRLVRSLVFPASKGGVDFSGSAVEGTADCPLGDRHPPEPIATEHREPTGYEEPDQRPQGEAAPHGVAAAEEGDQGDAVKNGEGDPERIHGERAPWVTPTERGNAHVLKSHKEQWSSHRQEYPPATELEFLHLLEHDEGLRRRLAQTPSGLRHLGLLLDQWIRCGRPHPVRLRLETLSGERTDVEHLAASFLRMWSEFSSERQSDAAPAVEPASNKGAVRRRHPRLVRFVFDFFTLGVEPKTRFDRFMVGVAYAAILISVVGILLIAARTIW